MLILYQNSQAIGHKKTHTPTKIYNATNIQQVYWKGVGLSSGCVTVLGRYGPHQLQGGAAFCTEFGGCLVVPSAGCADWFGPHRYGRHDLDAFFCFTNHTQHHHVLLCLNGEPAGCLERLVRHATWHRNTRIVVYVRAQHTARCAFGCCRWREGRLRRCTR